MTAVLRTSRKSFGIIKLSSLAPDEQSGHRVIPYHAHQRARRAGQPPDRLLIVDRERHADIGNEADAAYQVKQQQAAQDRKALQPLVAIGKKIVQDEIAGHGQQRAAGLRFRKRQIEDFERDEQRGQMHEQAGRSDHRKQQEAQRHHIAGQLRQHQPQEIQRHHRIEFAFTVQPRAEAVGNFLDPQIAVRGGDEIEQNLEALGGELRRQLFEAIPADHEEAAHWIGDLDPQHALGHFGCKRTGAGPLLVKTVGAAALDIAAAYHKVGFATLQQRQHDRQLRLVMLQVGIDDGGAGRARCQNALDTGAGQAAPSDPPDTADAGIMPRQAPYQVPGAVGGIVIDEDDFKADARERRFQPPKQRGDVVALVEGGDDDRKLSQCGGLRRVFGPRSDGFIHAASVYPIASGEAKAQFPNTGGEEPKAAKTGPKMPTTTNNRRAYIRRSRAIQWSSQRRSYEASTSPLRRR